MTAPSSVTAPAALAVGNMPGPLGRLSRVSTKVLGIHWDRSVAFALIYMERRDNPESADAGNRGGVLG